MIIQSLLYKVVAISVSLGMLIQVYVPTLVGPVPQPADRPADGLAEVLETAVGPELAPDGYLLDAGARQPANVFPPEPDALANPISLSRVQSAYVPGDAINNTLIVTFTVTNNRPPTIFPDVPPGTPITDTVALLAGFDFTADPNTIRGVALSDSLLGTAVLLDASPQPSRDGANLLFNLGDVPPSASVTATLTLQVPAAVADFTNLDSGAAAYGMLQGRAVSVATAPALLAPDSFGQYLRWTPDADIYDAEMLRQLGDLGADPVDLFAYVRGFGYESYEGSLRGTRGTLWSAAGSSMDQASLLIALLRASGVPARYAQGTLNTPLAQELILSMFPEPVRVVGRIAPGVETADPANDPALLAETQDHWWVQAYLNGAWVDLDPSFAAAQPGDAFAPVGQTHAEVPDALRHKVTLSVKVERIEPFDFTLADYAVTYPLTATFNTVALAGRPLLFAHFVQTDIQGGVFSNYFHTYTPYFVVGNYERLVQGEAFQDLLTNFPFGSAFVSGVWLTVDSIAPNGQTESYTRELKDIIGPAARQPTGFVNVDVNGNRGDPALPLLTQTDVMQIHVVPQTRTPAYETARLTSEIAEYGPQIAAAFDAATQLVVNPDEDAYVAFLNAHQPLILTAQYASLAFLGTTYHVRASAPEREFRSDAMLVRSYPARPKLILIAQSAFTSTTSTSFELLSISEKALAYPGQASDAAFSANLLRTIDDKMLEYQLMEEVFNTRPNSALTVFDEAIQNNADFALITPSTLNALASLAISDEAKGRINAAVTSGSSVYVPTEMVLVDGTPTIGWLEVAPTGDATFVTEDGRHAVDAGEAAILAAIIGGVAVIIAAGIGAAGAVVAALIAAFAAIVLAIAQVIAAGAAGMRLPAGASPATNVSSDVVLAIAQTSREAVAACHGQPGVNCADVVALLSPMQLAGAVASPQSPLADAWFSEAPAVADVPFASSPVAVTGSVAGTNLTAAVSTDVTALTDPATADWTTTAVSPFAFDSLTAANATLFDANGVQLASGSVAVGPSRSAAAQGSGLDASLSGLAGGLTFHAPAASGLAAGSQWLTYTAALDDAQPYTIALDDAAVMVNNSSTFTGALTLEISGPASLTGGGATAVPAFTPTAAAQAQAGHLILGPATGSFTAGGQPVGVANGVALGNYAGPVTVAEATAATDDVTLSGTADFFTLNLAPAGSTTPPSAAVTFQTNVVANFDDTYTVYAAAPAGWQVSVDAAGLVTAVPPRGALPAAYSILVTAQSTQYPDLFVSAVHTVTTTAESGMALAVTENLSTTVPMGQVLNPNAADYLGRGIDPFGHVNDGRANVPMAAYTVALTNTSTVPHTFDVSVAGLPAGWLLLTGAPGQTSTTLTLAAGQSGRLGFYVVPAQSGLPAPGASYAIDVTATAQADPGLTQTDSLLFTMPSLPFPYLHVGPEVRYATPGDVVAYDVTVTNVGNAAGSFPVDLSVSSNIYAQQASVTTTLPAAPASFSTGALAIGAAETRSVAVDTTGSAIGQSYLLAAESDAGGYAPVTYGRIQIVTPESGALFRAADACTLDSAALQASLESLALAVVELEYWCEIGDCPLPLRDNVVAAANNAAGYAETVAGGPLAGSADVYAVAAALAAHDDDADILADVAALSAAVSGLSGELCELEEHRPTARFTPYLDAVLLGDTAAFTLDVTNRGTLTTTYAITVTRPEGALLLNETLAPGETRPLPVDTTPPAIGAYDLAADVVATGPGVQGDVRTTASARLNVVDKFVQVTAVTANPPFVETGTSSTDLGVGVVNVAGIAQDVTARTRVLAPDGSTAYAADLPLTLLIGPPRDYALATVNTSGWASGVYTLTVDLLDGGGAPVPEGSGYGYLTVGQGLVADQALWPAVVAPGTVTVTTILTTEIAGQTIISTSAPVAGPPVNPRIFYNDARAALDDVRGMQDTAVSLIPADRPTAAPKPETALPAPRTTLSISGVYTRTEQDDPAIVTSGTWQTLSTSPGSGGSYMRSNTAGSSASFSFSGPWVAVGLLGDRFSGDAEIFIDGVSQGVVSTYRRETTPFSLHFSGLADTNHVISVTVVGTAVPQALSTYVYVDYVDVWNGTPPADGRFEENDPRVILSSSARFANSPVASGGAYAFRTDMTTWFPFHGDSFSYQAFAYTGGGLVQLSVDGQFLTTVDLFNWTQITRTFSFTGFTPGMHLLQVTGFYGNNTVDVMATPGTPPFTDPNPPPGAFTRYEAHHPDFRYNGLPFPSMGSSWTRTTASAADASGGQVIESFTIGDVASLTFNGSWASIGFGTGFGAGQAEVFLDGVSQGILDLYRREDGVTSLTLGSIGAGTHTISATVLGGGDLRIDYVDVWDGTPLPDGTFDWEDGRFYLSDTWFRTTNAGARGGDFLETDRGTVWFPFSGDTVSFESFFTSQLKSARLYVDDAYVGTFDLSGSSAPTPTLSLDGLGSGVHVLRVEHYRGRLSLNAFRTPGTAPFIQPPPPPSGFTRIEEDADDWLYNGLPYTQTVTSWSRVDNIFSSGASDGQYMQTSAVGNTAVYTINGASFGVGFVGERRGGQAEIFIDGVSQGVVDTFRQDVTPISAYFHGLPNATHTISITLLSTAHPNVGGSPTLYFDYLDVWDGTPLPDGFFEEDDSRVFRSPAWYDVNDAGASGGAYVDTGLNADSNMWFPFEGDSVTFQAMAFPSGARDAVRVWVDGVPQGVLNLYSQTPVTRPVSFGGFGPGLHVLTIERYQGETTVDGFAAPGTAPFYQPPTFTGLVRYEEDGGDILYNGYHYALRPTTWNASFPGSASERGIISSSTPGDTASLTFYGSWFNLGMRTRSNYGTAEIFVDGVSQGVITLTAPVEGPISFPFGGFITGTHALSVTVLSGAVVLDYVDVWDGTPVSDDFLNARMTEQNGRIHFGSGIGTYANPDAIDGDYSAVTLLNTPGNVWYTFVGDSFTYYAFSRTFGGTAEVYVDGVYTATVDLDYDFSEMPLAFHFTGLPYGPHVVRIKNGLNMRVDGFAANPQSLASYQPMVEWSDDTPAGNGAPFFGTVGIAASIAAGDVTGDGNVEIVVTADDYVNFGTLFLYRGDGSDTGDGDPIIWSIPFGGGAFRTWLGAPAIADLDGQPGAEIVVNVGNEVYALHGDGTTYWVTDTVSAFEVLASPAIANLDLDPEPEIVINVGNRVYVFEHDGARSWELTLPDRALPPVVADITGDGLQDIFLSTWNDDVVYLYDWNLGSPQLVWSQTLSSTLSGMFGSPAVADVDGQQPGGDPGPELAVSSNGYLTILDADGSVVWSTALDPGNPGGVSAADVDGDGEVELVTGMRYDDGIGIGRLYALNADGSLLWSTPAYDSSSANVASVLDLDGDGIYEVAWNGREDGFTIFNGADGSVIYNEPLAYSVTGTDYPAFVDVDNDGYAEVVAPALRGIRVFGWDGVWGPSRPIWNQQTYHITNINDDLTVPFSEANSWEVHNTYRTQTPLRNPVPSYGVSLTYTAAVTGVTVLPGTFSVPPDVTADPAYGWAYVQDAFTPVVTRTFVSELAGMQPGEVRRVSEGVEVVYTLAGGTNRLTLPSLYVTAPRIVSLSPGQQTAFAGGTAVYDVILTNPGATADTYTLSVAGIPAAWASLPGSVLVPAGGSVTVPLSVTVPAAETPDTRPVIVDVVTGAAAADAAVADLTIADGVDVTITPAWQAGTTGQPLTYTLTISSYAGTAVTYALAASGLADVTLPPSVNVSGGSASLSFQATPPQAGPQPFTVWATGDNGARDGADAVAEGQGRFGVTAALSQTTVTAGPATPALFDLFVTNAGTLPDTYALSVQAPAGWTAELLVNGTAVGQISPPPGPFATAQLALRVTPDANAAVGPAVVTVTAQSLANSGTRAVAAGTVIVGSRGVTVEFLSGPAAVDPSGTATWQVEVTNTGSAADSYDLLAAGYIAAFAQFTPASVSLNPGQSQTVQLTASGFGGALPEPVSVVAAARSQADPGIVGQDVTTLSFNAVEAVMMAWRPVTQTVVNELTAQFALVITNTGNVNTEYRINTSVPGASSQVALRRIPIPAQQSAVLLVDVEVPAGGTYVLGATAVSASGNASASAAATLIVLAGNQPPAVDAGPPQTAEVLELVQFAGTAVDPEGDAIVRIDWDFGDGQTASGTLTPTHTYLLPGDFQVTLTVEDDQGNVATDTVPITVTGAVEFFPIIFNGS